jgi:hypothetical protein
MYSVQENGGAYMWYYNCAVRLLVIEGISRPFIAGGVGSVGSLETQNDHKNKTDATSI